MSTFEEEQINQAKPSPAAPELRSGGRISRLVAAALTWESLAWLALLSSALITRFWNLGARVMSHDESEHVYFSWLLSKGSGYSHNPMMHGPLLFELTAFFDAIFKATDFTSRIVPALIGIVVVIVVPRLLRPWLGRLGAFVTSLLLLVSPYVLFYSRYNRHDIYEIAWALLAAVAILSYLKEQDMLSVPSLPSLVDENIDEEGEEISTEDIAEEDHPPEMALPVRAAAERPGGVDSAGAVSSSTALSPASGDTWLLVLAGAVALMFSTMETAFFYLAIFASFLFIRLLVRNGLDWQKIRHSAEFDLLIVLGTLGAFFSSQIALLVINPLWNLFTKQPFVPLTTLSSFGIEWSTGPYGMRIWGLMIVFWWLGATIGIFWSWRRWLKLAALFLVITFITFTTSFTNWSGIGTGFVGSLGYWLSQQGVARGSQPWYYYFIVFPIYEYLPLVGGLVALIYFAVRRLSARSFASGRSAAGSVAAGSIADDHLADDLPGDRPHGERRLGARSLSPAVQTFVLFVGWWAALIFIGLTIAGEKMPWLSTHITVPFILLTGWFLGQLLLKLRGEPENEPGEPSSSVGAARVFRPGVALALLPFAILYVLTARTSYLVNYVNYDSVIEFIDYAHGAPGVKWTVDDVNQVAARLGQGSSLSVGYDSANAWPLTWYFRDRTGFYGDQPNRDALLKDGVVIAGQENWQKVERFLGANYNRYEVIRIWWPMEDYKNLTWDRIRGALIDPQMRQAVWNIIWARDYHLYASLTGQNLDAPKQWPLQDRMRVYIRKDIAAQIPNLQLKSSQIADLAPQVDVYAAKRINVNPTSLVQPADLNHPRNLAFAPDGTLYVADSGNSRILHLDAQGKQIGAWGSRTPDKQVPPAQGTFNEPWGVAVDAQGSVYVADTWNHRIQKFDANGKFLLEWGTGGVATDGPDRFWGPRGIAISPDGDIYITDTGNRRVVVYDSQGKFKFEFSKDGDAQLDEPVGIAIDSQGKVYVADTWNARVAVFDAQGKYLSGWPVQAWDSNSIDDKPFITLDKSGNVYLSDPEAARVLVFNSTGAPLAEFGEFGSGENNFNLPTGLAASPSGEIWITDAGNNRLAVYPAVK